MDQLQLLQLLQNGGGNVDPQVIQQLMQQSGGDVGIGQFEQNQFGGGGPASALSAPEGISVGEPAGFGGPGDYGITAGQPTQGWDLGNRAATPQNQGFDYQGRHISNAYTDLDRSGFWGAFGGTPPQAQIDAYNQLHGQAGNTADIATANSPFGGDLLDVGHSAQTNLSPYQSAQGAQMNPFVQSGQVTLGDMPTVNGQFSSPFMDQYGGSTGNYADQISNSYGGFPTAQAAQMDLSGIPNPGAQAAGGSDALSFLLSGQGYDPRTLAAMNAGVTDNAANAGRSQAGNARLMAEQSGIAGSPAEMALEANARRNQAAQTQQGLNNVQIQNAQQGMQNLTTGAGMQQQLNLSNSQQANMMALQHAQNIIQGMNQNVANTQAANMANYQGSQQAAMAKSGARADFLANAGSGLNNAMLNKQTNADTQNANNAVNWGTTQAGLNQANNQFNSTGANNWNTTNANLAQNNNQFNSNGANNFALQQGQLNQNNNQFNTNVGENRWTHSLDALGQLVNGSNALGYDNNATQALASQGVGTSAAGNALVDIGSGLLTGKPTSQMDQVKVA